jgi:putative two-component system response regulator
MGLVGEAIPLESRIMAIADVYDALLSKRVYKPAMMPDEARLKIIEGAGTHFDPVMVEVMIENIDQFEEINFKYQDEISESPGGSGS